MYRVPHLVLLVGRLLCLRCLQDDTVEENEDQARYQIAVAEQSRGKEWVCGPACMHDIHPYCGRNECHVDDDLDGAEPVQVLTAVEEQLQAANGDGKDNDCDGYVDDAHGFGIYGYDNVAQKYTGTWLDSMGTGMAQGAARAWREENA